MNKEWLEELCAAKEKLCDACSCRIYEVCCDCTVTQIINDAANELNELSEEE